MSNFLTKDGLRTSTIIVIRKQLAFHFTAMVVSQHIAGAERVPDLVTCIFILLRSRRVEVGY